MRRISRACVTCTALASALCVPTSAFAAGADYFLKLEGVQAAAGTTPAARGAKVRKAGFEGQLSADGWSLGASQHGSLGTGGGLKLQPGGGGGSLSVKAALPGCRVGTRYRSAEVGGPDGRYALSDVTITSCSIGNIGLSYATIREAGAAAAR